MRATLKQMFSIVDGRLATEMQDVYSVLDAAMGQDLTTLALPWAMDKVKEARPSWYVDAEKMINQAKEKVGDDFEAILSYVDANHAGDFFEVTAI
jgi:GTP-binding protein EngB required for normal cell division